MTPIAPTCDHLRCGKHFVWMCVSRPGVDHGTRNLHPGPLSPLSHPLSPTKSPRSSYSPRNPPISQSTLNYDYESPRGFGVTPTELSCSPAQILCSTGGQPTYTTQQGLGYSVPHRDTVSRGSRSSVVSPRWSLPVSICCNKVPPRSALPKMAARGSSTRF
jgi:hypothetical protein